VVYARVVLRDGDVVPRGDLREAVPDREPRPGDLDEVAATGNPYFSNGNYSGGVAAILTALELNITGGENGGGSSSGEGRIFARTASSTLTFGA